jgi:hypothetical protein
MVADWSKKGLEGKTAALINLMRRRGPPNSCNKNSRQLAGPKARQIRHKAQPATLIGRQARCKPMDDCSWPQ